MLSTCLLAQCSGVLLDKCAPTVQDFVFLKSYTIKLSKGKKNDDAPVSKYSTLLTSGTKYRITSCNAEEFPGKVIVQLSDQTDRVMASTYNIKSKKHYPAVEFVCQKTGVYYLKYSFEDAKEGCAVGILSLKK